MSDLRQRLGELDEMSVPDMRADISRLAVELRGGSDDPLTEVRDLPYRWRGPLLAAATAAAILAVVTVAAFALGFEPPAVSDTPQSTVPAPTPTSVPGTTLGNAADAGWVAIDTESIPYSVTPIRLADGSWAAMRYDISSHINDYTGVLWTSSDGEDWISEDAPDLVGKVPRVLRSDETGLVAPDGQIWLATSSRGDKSISEVWMTEDGLTWHRIEWETPQPPAWDEYLTASISRLGDVLLMTASNSVDDQWQMVSTDGGRSFTDTAPFPEKGFAAAHWATDDELRALVASPSSEVTLWASEDGLAWVGRGSVTGLNDHRMGDLASMSGSLAVTTTSDALLARSSWDMWECEGSIAASYDGGSSWEYLEIETMLSVLDENALVCQAHSVDGWLAVGNAHPGQSGGQVWVSQNGIDWYGIDGFVWSINGATSVGTEESWMMPPRTER